MKLLDDFFTIRTVSESNDAIVFDIELKRSHIIYQGHFPGYPVTPGVIQLQILNELSEYHSGRKLRLFKLTEAKYLKVLNPDTSNLLRVTLHLADTDSTGLMQFKSSIHWNDEMVMKAGGYWKTVY